MKPTTKIALAGLFSAAGAVLTALAAEFNAASAGSAPAEAQPESTTTTEPPKTRKPREPKVEKPAEPAAAEPAAEQKEETASTDDGEVPKGVMTVDELRALIKPLVDAGRGIEVRKIVAKYSAGGVATMEPKHHAAFEKDIEALSY